MNNSKLLDWSGAPCVIAASGPSLSHEQITAAKAARVIVTNSTWRRVESPDVIYACDFLWWKQYHQEIKQAGLHDRCWTQDRSAAERFQLRYVRSEGRQGLGLNAIRVNGNSGAGANGAGSTSGQAGNNGAGGTTGGGITNVTPIPVDQGCSTDTYEASGSVLDIFIMQDRSGSMDDATAAGPDKWTVVTGAINAFVADPQSNGIGAGIGFYDARSRHPGGVNVAMTDGSVRFIKDSIAITTWYALATREGGEALSSDSY